jgi:Ca-activated chloride channel family protein
MRNNEDHASFSGTSGEAVALRSVHVQGSLDGLMLRVQSRQTYRNETGHNLETVYTFPLAWGTTLLGLNVELAGMRMAATVIEKKQATEKYEKAIEEGDMPVMVEKSASGLYTASLGNLKDGEEAVIELEYAQLLRFEQGRVRLSVPTTLAPRYGDAHGPGRLAPHETDAVNPMVEYPFTLKLDLRGQIARAKLSCPSHKVSTTATELGMTVLLEQGGMLDRDFILNLEGLEGQSFAVTSPDGDEHAVLASFCPKLPGQDAAPLLLKILVDSSGSMGGDSIHQARAALHEVAQALTPADHVSYSRFGSSVQHVIPKLEACTPQLIGQVLARAIQATDADLGGTELNQALQSTFAIQPPPDGKPAIDVLLITDGDVWEIDEIVASAIHSEHRVFAVGVGSSPAESLLRDLAEKTGGACELVSPNEDVTGAVMRMFRRMRAAQSIQLHVEWGTEPLWQSALPRQLFDGETVHVFATLAQPPASSPILKWEANGLALQSQPEVMTQDTSESLARLGGARQLVQAKSEADGLALALKYQLVSSQTNLFLVHVRAEYDKAIGLPQLQQIEQMQAAGWGGFGSVKSGMKFGIAPASMAMNAIACADFGSLSVPSVWRTNRTQAAARVDALSSNGFDDFEIPAFLRKQAEDVASTGMTPAELIEAFNDAALGASDFDEALSVVLSQRVSDDMTKLLNVMSTEAGSVKMAWALLLDWLVVRLVGQCTLSRHGLRLLRHQLAGVDESVKLPTSKRLAAALPALDRTAWGPISVTFMDKTAHKVKNLMGAGRLGD